MEARAKEGWPSEEGGNEYLQKHKILELFEEISAHLFYRQPGKLQFLKKYFDQVLAQYNLHYDHVQYLGFL